MKKHLLKQSVIAILVGSAVSSYALAQEINTNDNSGAAFTKGVRNSIVAAIQGNSQILNGFKKGEKILAVNNDNKLEERDATDADVNEDPFGGVGLVKAVIDNEDYLYSLADGVTKLGEQTNKSVQDLRNIAEDLDATLASTQDLVDEHSDRLDTVESDISNLKNIRAYQDLDTVKGLVNGVKDDLNNHISEEFSDLVDTVGEIEGTVEKNTSRITDIRNKQLLQITRLSNHSDRIGANETTIAANKTDIATNKAAIEANAANITAHTATIATHTQRLDHLDNRVNNLNKDLKRGLAAQAALNGLFQPYNVGKLNLTAAVGGYKSQTAVAVGTGYRYNENIATKAGVAFTRGGSATYNVGVNFEW